MQFRRSGQRDERRRKVLLDDSTPEGAAARSATASPNKAAKTDAIARAYAQAAMEETDTRVADLIPTRPLGVAVLFLLGLTVLVAVQTAYTFLPDWIAAFGPAGGQMLDVTAAGSLAAWVSALLLGLAAACTVLIYGIRRHKMDDYRGRYRLWLWAAAGLLLASVDAVAGLRPAFDVVVGALSGRALLIGSLSWATAACFVIGGALGVRVAIDTWRSRGSTATLAGAGLLYAMAAWLAAAPVAADAMLAAMASSFVASLAHLTLLLGLMLYARYVLLEARGRLRVRRPRKKKAKPAADAVAEVNAAAGSTGRKIKIDPPHYKKAAPQTEEQPAAAKSEDKPSAASSGKAAASTDDDGPAEGSPQWRKLPKSERRRLAKLRRESAAA